MNLVLVCWLLLTSVSALSAADFYVSSLPNISANAEFPVMHAGLLESTAPGASKGSLFFWHVRASKSAAKDTIIWFNGGPGCSSMDGNFLEIGPLRFAEDGELYTVEGSWAEHANIMFIDQPFGTGYSSPTSEAHADSLEDAGAAVVRFLEQYLLVFPELAATNIYLAGESFAGQSIPYLYEEIRKNDIINEKLGGIKGIILGNPWIDPPHQYLSYINFAKSRSIIPQKSWASAEEMQKKCMEKLSEPGMTERVQVTECERIPMMVIQSSQTDSDHCINIYDYTLTSAFPQCGMDWPQEVPLMVEYLSRDDVKTALHIPLSENTNQWTECNGGVRKFLQMDTSISSLHLMPSILAEVPVLLMIGGHDFVCNIDGINEFVRNLQFNGQMGFSGLPEETGYGTFQSERNLSVAHVTNGSHMLPVDHLKLSQKLLHRFASIEGNDASTDKGNSGQNEGSSDDKKDGNDSSSEPENKNPKEEHGTYKRASIAALCIVIFAVVVIAVIYFKNGRGLTLRGVLHAIMHSSFKRERQDVELDIRRPFTEPILEDEHENDDYDFEV